ncbi:MAG: energy transducer TonB [Saprospiraceae bacterium]
MKEDKFIKKPYFKGGDKAMKAFVSQHLTNPSSVISGKIRGEVVVQYDIDIHGNVIDTKIISGLDDLCNAEAIRVVKLMKFVVPKNPRKLILTFHKTIRIHFHNKPEAIPREQVNQFQPFQYNYFPTKVEESDSKQPNIFTYTINI